MTAEVDLSINCRLFQKTFLPSNDVSLTLCNLVSIHMRGLAIPHSQLSNLMSWQCRFKILRFMFYQVHRVLHNASTSTSLLRCLLQDYFVHHLLSTDLTEKNTLSIMVIKRY